MFRNKNEFKIDIPRRIDPNQNEKWAYTISLDDTQKYATLYAKDFVTQETANFSANSGQVSGTTESGKILRHYKMARRDSVRKVCSGSIAGIITTGVNGTATHCYSDQLRNMSCADKKDGEAVSFSMNCSEIRVERFGGNIVNKYDKIWWLSELEQKGNAALMQINSLRAYKQDKVSPSAMIVAVILTEFPSQIQLVQRPFFVDVSVVIVPNWLIIITTTIVTIVVFASISASLLASVKNFVLLQNWQELFIANLLQPLDGLNRAKKKQFRCVVGDGQGKTRRYGLFIEPKILIAAEQRVSRMHIA